ncbi:MAG: pseudouridine synthase, partial [Porticoccaceae bacterium]
MAKLILLNKPFQVLSQFTTDTDKRTLADYLSIKNIYPAGRLDFDSEGLLLLTDNGRLQAQISDPRYKLP